MPLSARDLTVVQQLLGQAKPETAAVYARVPGRGARDGCAGRGRVATISAMTP
jgi:hypothetical protein